MKKLVYFVLRVVFVFVCRQIFLTVRKLDKRDIYIQVCVFPDINTMVTFPSRPIFHQLGRPSNGVGPFTTSPQKVLL